MEQIPSVIPQETETTIVNINDEYIIPSGIRCTRVYSDPGISYGKPAVLLKSHPDFTNIHSKLIKGTTHRFKWSQDSDGVAIIDNMSPPKQQILTGTVGDILRIQDILNMHSTNNYEIRMCDCNNSNFIEEEELNTISRRDKLICNDEILKLITIDKMYTFTYVKDYGSNKYRILYVK